MAEDVRQGSAKRRCIGCSPRDQERTVALQQRAVTNIPPSKRAPASSAWASQRSFGIVIDAGSSGSRIQIYSWLRHDVARSKREKAGLPLNVLPKVEVGVEVGEGWHAKTTPGISTFGPDPEGVDDHLKPLLEHALSVIPQASVAETPIYLLATAGMRLLPDNQREAILDRACRFIRNNYSFNIGNCRDTVRVISGEEEGLFGWIAVNYLMDGFDRHVHSDESGHAASSTYGFLDMGGASTQIAFEPSPGERIKHADNLVDVHLRQLDGTDVAHPVFVTTWLGYGTNQARQRFVDAQVAGDAQATQPDNVISEGEAHLKIVDDPCLPASLTLSETRHPGFAFRGSGDFAACVRRQSPLLNKEAPCTDEPCLFAGVHAPSIDFSVNHFIGISEYWYSTQELWSLGGVYDFVSFEKHAAEYCSRTWDDIRAEHSSDAVQQERLELQCFKAAWIINILHEGIGIPRYKIDAGGSGNAREANVASTAERKAGEKGLVKPTADAIRPSFQSLEQVGEVAISWTLGKMVLEVSQSVQSGYILPNAGRGALIFPPAWRKRISLNTTAPLGAAILLLALFAWILSSARRRKMMTSWQRLNVNGNATADYALVGMEEGSVLPQLGARSVSTPRLGSATTTPRLGFPGAGSNKNDGRPRMLRHALSTPAIIGKRVPSSKDRHGRAISTDVGSLAVVGTISADDEADDDASSQTSLSRQASQSSLSHWGTNRLIRGRSATPGGTVFGGEDV